MGTLEELFKDFLPEDTTKKSIKDGAPITTWLFKEDKERYDRLQKLTNRRFGKKVRETVVQLMDYVEKQYGEKLAS